MSASYQRRRCVVAFLAIPLFALSLAAPRALGDDDDKKEKIAKLYTQMHDAYEDEAYDKAIKFGKAILELDPKNAEAMYNVGCCYAMRGEEDDALEYLEKSVKHGFRDIEQFENDTDLDKLRKLPRFKKLMAVLKDESADDSKAAEKSDAAKKPAPPPKPDAPAKAKPKTPAERAAEAQRLTQKLLQLAQQGKYAEALEVAEQARDLMPQQGVLHYNVGCMLARLDRKAEAMKALRKAVELGFSDADQFEQDSDLDSLRKDPAFKKLMAEIKGEEEEEAKPTPKPETPRPSAPREARPRGGEPKAEWHIALPTSYQRGKSYPLIIALHGSGQNLRVATEDWEDAADDVGAILLVPQGRESKAKDKYAWGSSIAEVEAVVMQALESVQKEYKIDKDRIILVGFSQGGWATYQLAIRQPSRFRAIVPMAGRFEGDMEKMAGKANLDGLRAYIMVGSDDDELDGNRRAAKALKRAGATVELVEYEETGHAWPKQRVREQVKALKWALKGEGRHMSKDEGDDRPTRRPTKRGESDED